MLALAAASALVGCSENEVVEDNPNFGDNAIRFAANTEYARARGKTAPARAQDITINNLESFNVYAYITGDKAPYMDNVTVSKTGTNTWTYSPLKYWPSGKTLDFYAFAPATWLGSNSPLSPVPFECNYPMADQDLVYAVLPSLSGLTGTSNAQVIFNFRHALSKVTVRMSSANDKVLVKVTNVYLNNLYNKGNFNFPSGSTSDPRDENNTGTWTDLSAPINYLYLMAQDVSDIITLTTEPTDMSDAHLPYGGGKFLIPQTLTWRSMGSGNDNYIAVMCSVYDAKTGAKLWPNSNTPPENVVQGSTFGDGLLKFPLSTAQFSEWQPGYHYIYNLVINGSEDMGAIEFGTPTVDSYVDVTTSME